MINMNRDTAPYDLNQGMRQPEYISDTWHMRRAIMTLYNQYKSMQVSQDRNLQRN